MSHPEAVSTVNMTKTKTEAEASSPTEPTKRKKLSTPDEGYICKHCGLGGHWIQQCPQKPKRRKLKKNKSHVPVPGVDPSADDVARAKELQSIKPPLCSCGLPSRLKKVKRSKYGGETSRAIGKYFFFCAKPKLDDTKCRFARPVEDEIATRNKTVCTFFAKTGTCKKGDACLFLHEKPSASTTASKEEES
eukprot:scaffold6030_cov199-Amphora_coffeaeformis.AAC.11